MGTIFTYHIEHITARQHGGLDTLENLALSCHLCNAFKGPNLTSIDPDITAVTRLFHPREDRWEDHFQISVHRIVGKSGIGRTTVFLLRMNAPQRIELRTEWEP